MPSKIEQRTATNKAHPREMVIVLRDDEDDAFVYTYVSESEPLLIDLDGAGGAVLLSSRAAKARGTDPDTSLAIRTYRLPKTSLDFLA